MAIKSPQTLVAEALKVVKTITPEKALKISSENNYLATSSDITENINVICEVELSNIWIYKSTYGCLWILKKIVII